MNKEMFINVLSQWLNDTGYNPADCHVSHGGSMLMLGLRSETEDIDLTVSQEIWDDLLSKGFKYKTLPATDKYPEVNIMPVNEYIDVHLVDKNFDGVLINEGVVYYRDMKTTLLDKLKLDRKKDKADILMLVKTLYGEFNV